MLSVFLFIATAPVFADVILKENSSPRFVQPVSKNAENVTVITSDDITRRNAHTLAELLQTVPGVQLSSMRTPTAATSYTIQGTANEEVLVLIDGIRQNDYDQGRTLLGLIPVQQIERIEIIKGAASPAWGAAPGGVINIITKTPVPDRTATGMVSGSIGSAFTADTRAELSGTYHSIGYYLTAGNLRSDGLSTNTATNMNNLFGKFSYLLPGSGTVTLGGSNLSAQPGMNEGNTTRWGFVHQNNEYRRSSGFLKFSKPFGDAFTLDIDGYVTDRDDRTKYGSGTPGAIVIMSNFAVQDSSRGLNSRLTWGDSHLNMVTGLEYTHVQATYKNLMSTGAPEYDQGWNSWALYGTGSYTRGRLTVVPGIRMDLTGIAGDNLSYTLGSSYVLDQNTTFRAYAAQGFTPMAPHTQSGGPQKLKTIQGGVESSAVPFLWLKGTLFYNTLRGGSPSGTLPRTNQNRQGLEVEARTMKYSGVFLTGGYTYLYATNADTGDQLHTTDLLTVPPHTVKLALNYDHPGYGLRSTLTGNYVWWNSLNGYSAGDSGIIWDLNLNWKMKDRYGLSPELFCTGHNLFSGVQTTDTTLYTNATRWFEGGVKVRF